MEVESEQHRYTDIDNVWKEGRKEGNSADDNLRGVSFSSEKTMWVSEIFVFRSTHLSTGEVRGGGRRGKRKDEGEERGQKRVSGRNRENGRIYEK